MASHTDTLNASDVLTNPSEHNVDEVLAALEDASAGDVARTQQLEAAGKNRKAIAEFEPQLPAADPGEPTFSIDRILGDDGVRLTGRPHHIIAGALHGVTETELTRSQVLTLVENFLKRPVQTAEQEA